MARISCADNLKLWGIELLHGDRCVGGGRTSGIAPKGDPWLRPDSRDVAGPCCSPNAVEDRMTGDFACCKRRLWTLKIRHDDNRFLDKHRLCEE
ncbi:hypothetical protein Trco_001708 [Trichoderma cornu-damae]|uniref:Uncharacterized protein n=1 Tax=Trichoderma cornu-damae TaxID=654480 RepID=A0A9P8TXR9_9HYPO|nr:hypothetical protein Trco_001708 [Trichoderma cornu-damae]